MNGKKGCGDQDRKVTWLSLSDKVLEQVSQNIRTMTDQAAASLKEHASNTLEQKVSSNQATLAPALADVEQRPEMPSQKENREIVEITHQAEYDGPRPDTLMDVQSDNVDIIASNSERSSLIGPGTDVLHSA